MSNTVDFDGPPRVSKGLWGHAQVYQFLLQEPKPVALIPVKPRQGLFGILLECGLRDGNPREGTRTAERPVLVPKRDLPRRGLLAQRMLPAGLN